MEYSYPLPFHKPSLSDKPAVDRVFTGTTYYGCFCSFATLFLWKDRYVTEIAVSGDTLFIRGRDEDGSLYYMYPMGRSYDIRACIAALREDAAGFGEKLCILCAEGWQCDELRTAFPDEFSFIETRDEFDYLYRTEHLIQLGGKKFHAKRNHISRFTRSYPDWRYEDISPANLRECAAFTGQWLENAISGEADGEEVYELCMENSAIALALRQFDTLGLVGGLLRVGGNIVALTLGEPLNDRVFVTHFEKADMAYDGAYAVINQQFAEHRLTSYEYINREEDMGKEGLRRAKLSYYPDILLEKYTALAR